MNEARPAPWLVTREAQDVVVLEFDGGEQRTMDIAGAAALAGLLLQLAERPAPPVLVLVIDLLHADLNEVIQMSHGRSIRDWAPWVEAISRLQGYPSATLVAVPRQATCGGFEIALAADIRIAAPRARLGVLESRMGIMPGAGGTQRTARLAGFAAAALLCYCGESVSGTEAHRLGLVQLLDDDPVALAIATAERVASRGSHVVQGIKRALLASLPAGVEGFQEEGRAFLSVVKHAEAAAGMQSWLDRQARGVNPAADESPLP
jgi:enoyl-CoA hydratase/carnithine racemase